MESLNLLELCGLGFLIIVLAIVFILIYPWIENLKNNIKTYFYKKRRFKRTPIANCYCLYCVSYNVETKKCCNSRSGKGMIFNPNDFCSYAYRLTTSRELQTRQMQLELKEDNK